MRESTVAASSNGTAQVPDQSQVRIIAWMDGDSVLPPIPLYDQVGSERTAQIEVLPAFGFELAVRCGWSLRVEEISELHAKFLHSDLHDDAYHTHTIDAKLAQLERTLVRLERENLHIKANFATGSDEILRRLATLSLLHAVEAGELPQATALLRQVSAESPGSSTLLAYGDDITEAYAEHPSAIAWVDLNSSAIAPEYLALLACATKLAPAQSSKLFSDPQQQLQGAVPSLWLGEGAGAVLEVPTLQQQELEERTCLRYLRVALGPELIFTKHCVKLRLVEDAWRTLTAGPRRDIDSPACILAGLYEQSLLQAHTHLRVLERETRERASPLTALELKDEVLTARHSASLAEARTYIETLKEALSQFKTAEGEAAAAGRKHWFALLSERITTISLLKELTTQHLESSAQRRQEAEKARQQRVQSAQANVESSFKEECYRFGLLGTVTKLLLDAEAPWLKGAGTLLMIVGAGYYAWRLNGLIAERRGERSRASSEKANVSQS
jgi:hypothetical protein